jgi:hypothetical protein
MLRDYAGPEHAQVGSANCEIIQSSPQTKNPAGGGLNYILQALIYGVFFNIKKQCAPIYAPSFKVHPGSRFNFSLKRLSHSLNFDLEAGHGSGHE